jgi:hypothetical protein
MDEYGYHVARKLLEGAGLGFREKFYSQLITSQRSLAEVCKSASGHFVVCELLLSKTQRISKDKAKGFAEVILKELWRSGGLHGVCLDRNGVWVAGFLRLAILNIRYKTGKDNNNHYKSEVY